MTNVSEEVSEHLRCSHCKGLVHEKLDEMGGWWCILCGAAETFDPQDRQRQPCTGERLRTKAGVEVAIVECSFGWNEVTNRSCVNCGGSGLELSSA